MFERLAPAGVACQLVPRGLTGLTALPYGSPASSLFDAGAVGVTLAGGGMPVEDALSLYARVASRRALRSGTILAGGGPRCSTEIFVGLQIGRAGHGPSVLR